MKQQLTLAVLLTAGPLFAQVAPLTEPEFMSCRSTANAPLGKNCLYGADALEDFRRENPDVLAKILRLRSFSTETEVREQLGAQHLRAAPVIRAKIGATEYESRSFSWWALGDPALSDRDRASQGGTIEVQFINDRVATVWWHRAYRVFLHVKLSDTPRVGATTPSK